MKSPPLTITAKTVTYATKLVQWRREMQRLAELLMEDDQFEIANKIVAAAALVKTVHDECADYGCDEEEWSDSDDE